MQAATDCPGNSLDRREHTRRRLNNTEVQAETRGRHRCRGMAERARTGKQQEEEVEAAIVEVLGEPVTAHVVCDD